MEVVFELLLSNCPRVCVLIVTVFLLRLIFIAIGAPKRMLPLLWMLVLLAMAIPVTYKTSLYSDFLPGALPGLEKNLAENNSPGIGTPDNDLGDQKAARTPTDDNGKTEINNANNGIADRSIDFYYVGFIIWIIGMGLCLMVGLLFSGKGH